MRCVAEVAPRVLPAVGTISSMTTQDATIRARGAVGTLRLWLMAHSDGGCGTAVTYMGAHGGFPLVRFQRHQQRPA